MFNSSSDVENIRINPSVCSSILMNGKVLLVLHTDKCTCTCRCVCVCVCAFVYLAYCSISAIFGSVIYEEDKNLIRFHSICVLFLPPSPPPIPLPFKNKLSNQFLCKFIMITNGFFFSLFFMCFIDWVHSYMPFSSMKTCVYLKWQKMAKNFQYSENSR